jgi:hypothetical protein
MSDRGEGAREDVAIEKIGLEESGADQHMRLGCGSELLVILLVSSREALVVAFSELVDDRVEIVTGQPGEPEPG